MKFQDVEMRKNGKQKLRVVSWLAVSLVVGFLADAPMVCASKAIHPSSFILHPSHKFHATIAQLEYNAKEQSVEAVIRFFADDFETAISQHAKREIKFNTPQALKDKANSDAVFSYVRERFELKGKNGNAVKLNWVGMEIQADMVWVYFEGKLPGGLSGAQMRNRLMQELFDDQVNIVNFKYDGKQTGTMFNVQDGFKVVPDKK